MKNKDSLKPKSQDWPALIVLVFLLIVLLSVSTNYLDEFWEIVIGGIGR